MEYSTYCFTNCQVPLRSNESLREAFEMNVAPLHSSPGHSGKPSSLARTGCTRRVTYERCITLVIQAHGTLVGLLELLLLGRNLPASQPHVPGPARGHGTPARGLGATHTPTARARTTAAGQPPFPSKSSLLPSPLPFALSFCHPQVLAFGHRSFRTGLLGLYAFPLV